VTFDFPSLHSFVTRVSTLLDTGHSPVDGRRLASSLEPPSPSSTSCRFVWRGGTDVETGAHCMATFSPSDETVKPQRHS
jgi:hypothetical protein